MNLENPIERCVEALPSSDSSVHVVTRDDTKRALRRIKKGKALGLDNIPIEARQSLDDLPIGILTALFLKLVTEEKMPNKWRKSTLYPFMRKKAMYKTAVTIVVYN